MFGVAALIVLGVTAMDPGTSDPPTRRPTLGTSPLALRPIGAPRLTNAQVNRQDRPDDKRRREEGRTFDRRPLLSALPTTLQGVRFDIGGLATDGRTTIIRARAMGLGARRARIAFETLKRRNRDRSQSYRLQIEP